MIQVIITAKTLEDLERQQDRAIEMAKSLGEPVVCNQKLRIPRNSPCICNSGRKWKKCCEWESDTQVTFYPPGYKHVRTSSKSRIMVAAMLAGLSGPTLR